VFINVPDLFLIITDIDDTLYPLSSGISAQTAKNIEGNDLPPCGLSTFEGLNVYIIIIIW
jgi:hypothetical protein